MKGQKGITLVALVITIIVMLILTGVTITLSLDAGLLDKANEAKTETEADAQEDNRLVTEGTVLDNTNNTYVNIFERWNVDNINSNP